MTEPFTTKSETNIDNCVTLQDDIKEISQSRIENSSETEESLKELNGRNDRVCPWMKKQDSEIPNIQESHLDSLEINNNIYDTNDFHGIHNTTKTVEEHEINLGTLKIPPRIRTSDVKPNPGASFNMYNINSNILLVLKEKGWHWPSPIQEETIPKIIGGKNVIARSKNGTGKTGAYAISLLNIIATRKKVQSIIIVPTRELALQTANVCISLAKYLADVQVMVTTGGTDLAEDIFRLTRPINVIVGTPGRIHDIVSYKTNILGEVVSIILDEADKLLSVDFKVSFDAY